MLDNPRESMLETPADDGLKNMLGLCKLLIYFRD